MFLLFSIYKQKFRKRIYLLLSYFLSQKQYWNIVGKFSTLDSILDNCNDETYFYKTGKDVVDFFQKEGLMNSNDVTLQIGSGIGRIEKSLSKYVKHCYGVDISEVMVGKAKKGVEGKNVTFIATDGQNLPFEDNTFDFIYSILVFQHMPTSLFKKNLKEIKRVLKPEGKFLFQIPLDEHNKMKNPEKNNPWLMRYYKKAEIKRFLNENRLEIIKEYSGFSKYHGEPFHPNYTILARKNKF